MLALTFAGMVAAAGTPAFAASGVLDGISSTTNVAAGTGACLNGPASGDPVNCNRYTDKPDVWLSGLSTSGASGTYYFAVLAPGGQNDPTDGATDNLSDGANGTVDDRTFTLTNGVLSNTGSSHQLSGGKIQVFPFDDTTNNGGVYILAICSLDTGHCKYDAFKVGPGTPPVTGEGAPSAVKTANPTHVRKVHWGITKTVDGKSSETFNQGTPVTLQYSVAVTKTVDYDTYGLTGSITVSNGNDTPLAVTVAETGLNPAAGTCALDSSGDLLVPAKDAVSLDPGTASVSYTCTFASAPDANTSYTNTATVGYDIGNGPQSLPVASDPFFFPAATLSNDSAPESITVSDPNAPPAAGFPHTASAEGTTTFPYTQTIFNSNCVTYINTASIVETGQPPAQTTVTFCGPNTGGLTMGWWQNKNGQALLKANLANACSTVNGDLPASFVHGALAYLPDAYTQNKTFSAASYQYLSAACATSGAKSYLPTFDLNVFTSANAAGTGTMMVEGQWLTTALDTASYPVFTSAGRPTLSSGQLVQIPAALRAAPLGLNACDTVQNLLRAAAAQYPNYASSKTLGVTPALITLLNAINNNQAITCQ